MNKNKIISTIILENADIHHNISTLGMKLPEAPDEAPYEIFEDACADVINQFCNDWQYEYENDCGNRNLCGCNATKKGEKRKKDNSNINHPENILTSGACKKHDLWHIYTTGRGNATMYWTKYWNEKGFLYDEDELKEMSNEELKKMLAEMCYFKKKTAEMMKCLYPQLEYQYEQWAEENAERKRREAMGYYKTLEELLNSSNPAIVRLAKGIKKEITK